ncbi:MAG: hypothetical protein ACLU4N_08335 [Butyricimonas faecihominis]
MKTRSSRNERLFWGKGEATELADYTQPLQDLATVYEGKMSENAYGKCIDWIAKALTYEMVVPPCTFTYDDRRLPEEHVKPRRQNNPITKHSLPVPIENKAEMKQLQQMIQQSLQGL